MTSKTLTPAEQLSAATQRAIDACQMGHTARRDGRNEDADENYCAAVDAAREAGRLCGTYDLELPGLFSDTRGLGGICEDAALDAMAEVKDPESELI